jgi:hypothetical protein
MAAQNKPTGVRVNALNLADRYLKALGWPSTPTSRRVLAAWFMRESPRVSGSATDIYVVGNNPLNMACFSNCVSYWLAGGGSHKIIVFPSEAAGIQSFGSLIGNGNHGYDKIESAFKNSSTDPAVIVKAINNSGWVTGKTGGHSYIYRKNGKLINGLLNTYNGLGSHDLSANNDYSGPTLADALGHDVNIGSPKDVTAIVAELTQKYPNLPKSTLEDMPTYLIDFVGKNASDVPFNYEGIPGADPSLNADKTGKNVPLNNPFDFFGALAGKALGVGAVLLGGGLIIFGAIMVAKDTYSSNGTGGGMLDVTPIIVKD